MRAPVVVVGARRARARARAPPRHPAGEQVGVERVDDRVGLGVVAEQHLLRTPPGAWTRRLQQGRQLVGDLGAQRAEAAAEQVAQVVLEDELVVLDAVERSFAASTARICVGLPEMMQICGVALRRERAQQRRRAGHRLLVARPSRAPCATRSREGVELGAQVGLVEVPAVDVCAAAAGRWRSGSAIGRALQRCRPSRMTWARSDAQRLGGDLDRVGDRRAPGSGRAP